MSTNKLDELPKLTIWSLYDDGNMSYNKAISKFFPNIVNISIGKIAHFDINNYYQIDLSIFNDDLINELAKLPKPDIILASPPCESWSNADVIKNIKEITSFGIELTNYETFVEFMKTSKMQRNFFHKQKTRLLGEATSIATFKIIQHFKPKIWIIENPQTSKIWKYFYYYLNFRGFENKTNYAIWDNTFSLKPTIFMSNINLYLTNKKPSIANKWRLNCDYLTRSMIPEMLIKSIIDKCVKFIQVSY